MKKNLIILLVLLSIFLLGFKIFKSKNSMDFLNIKKGSVKEAIYGLGKVKSDQIFEVKVGVTTNIQQVYVVEGQEVGKDSNLIKFEGIGIFKAPFAGTVTSLNFQAGQIVFPQVTILRLENLSKTYIEVSLEQEAALKVKKNQKAHIIFETLINSKLYGNVESVYPKEGEFLARINVENIPSNILPGMTADIVIDIGSKEDALLIPVKAISEGRVVRFRDDKKEFINVKIGFTDGIWAEVIEGDLNINDMLVVKKTK